jgi:hypothetical protein
MGVQNEENMRKENLCDGCWSKNRYAMMAVQNEDGHKMRKVRHCHGYWFKHPYVATVVEIQIVKYG